MNERIIYRHTTDKRRGKLATLSDGGEWLICVGKHGGDLRRSKTISAMDREMTKRGYQRTEG
jgi:hypothetical protein